MTQIKCGCSPADSVDSLELITHSRNVKGSGDDSRQSRKYDHFCNLLPPSFAWVLSFNPATLQTVCSLQMSKCTSIRAPTLQHEVMANQSNMTVMSHMMNQRHMTNTWSDCRAASAHGI